MNRMPPAFGTGDGMQLCARPVRSWANSPEGPVWIAWPLRSHSVVGEGQSEMSGRKERGRRALFITGPLRGTVRDDHEVVRMDRSLDRRRGSGLPSSNATALPPARPFPAHRRQGVQCTVRQVAGARSWLHPNRWRLPQRFRTGWLPPSWEGSAMRQDRGVQRHARKRTAGHAPFCDVPDG